MKYCSTCGSSVSLAIPAGDNRQRFVCNNQDCGAIHYQNPRIITGCLPTQGDHVLLCKRAIEPKYGLWTLPAGFMENGESTEQGALRESWEEAQATCIIDQLYGVYNLPHINQVYFIYKATLADNDFKPGDESLEVKLFSEADLPWENLAFSVMKIALNHYFIDRQQQQLQFHSGTIDPSGQFT
ncbi:MAG: NUDIX hydrolase [Cellvibrionaceae bacterium]|nr:NUDIX hydrolase [Cellvibrionaceae bacterium]